MALKMSSQQLAAEALIIYFGSQKKAAEALNIDQTAISNWLKGKNRVREIHALKAEALTGGEVKAADLCPTLGEVGQVSQEQRYEVANEVNG